MEAYDFILSQLDVQVKAAKEAFHQWSRWAPAKEKEDYQSRMKGVESCSAKLVSGKAAMIQAKAEEEANKSATPVVQSPSIKLSPTALPRFDGSRRNFHSWKIDWEVLQRQGEPTGSKEVRKLLLFNILDEKVLRDLGLSTYRTADEFFRTLENRFGN